LGRGQAQVVGPLLRGGFGCGRGRVRQLWWRRQSRRDGRWRCHVVGVKLRRIPLEIRRLPPSMSLWFGSHCALDSASGFVRIGFRSFVGCRVSLGGLLGRIRAVLDIVVEPPRVGAGGPWRPTDLSPWAFLVWNRSRVALGGKPDSHPPPSPRLPRDTCAGTPAGAFKRCPRAPPVPGSSPLHPQRQLQ
jgi:hypothetical protein